MNEKYIELRNRSTFGDIINTYFLFLKYNFKAYTNLYLRYNAIGIIFSLIAAYLLVTGFMGLASQDFRFGVGNSVTTDKYFIFGMILLFLVWFISSLVNYSFSSSFLADYVNNKGTVRSKNIWNSILNNIGTIVIFILIGGLMYLVVIVISGFVSLIPFLGLIFQYGIAFTLNAIFGLTFMSIFSKPNGFGQSISEGFDFTFSNFWRVVLFGLVIGILNTMILFLLISIPGFLIGIYSIFSIESSIDLTTSTFATLLYTLMFAVFLICYIYTQALSQIAYGILYYNLYEIKYNVFLQKKIDQIGVNES